MKIAFPYVRDKTTPMQRLQLDAIAGMVHDVVCDTIDGALATVQAMDTGRKNTAISCTKVRANVAGMLSTSSNAASSGTPLQRNITSRFNDTLADVIEDVIRGQCGAASEKATITPLQLTKQLQLAKRVACGKETVIPSSSSFTASEWRVVNIPDFDGPSTLYLVKKESPKRFYMIPAEVLRELGLPVKSTGQMKKAQFPYGFGSVLKADGVDSLAKLETQVPTEGKETASGWSIFTMENAASATYVFIARKSGAKTFFHACNWPWLIQQGFKRVPLTTLSMRRRGDFPVQAGAFACSPLNLNDLAIMETEAAKTMPPPPPSPVVIKDPAPQQSTPDATDSSGGTINEEDDDDDFGTTDDGSNGLETDIDAQNTGLISIVTPGGIVSDPSDENETVTTTTVTTKATIPRDGSNPYPIIQTPKSGTDTVHKDTKGSTNDDASKSSNSANNKLLIYGGIACLVIACLIALAYWFYKRSARVVDTAVVNALKIADTLNSYPAPLMAFNYVDLPTAPAMPLVK